jgi:hypothetical protein
MMRKVFGLALALGIVTAASMAFEETPPPKISHPLPFKVGETLVYEIVFSKLIFTGSIGQLTLTVAKASDAQDPQLFELRAEAVSKGFFTWLFGLKVDNHYHSLVNSQDLGLHCSSTIIHEGNKYREQKTIIDRERGRLIYSERDLNNASAEPKVKQADSPRWVQDLLSAVYFARTQRLKEGGKIAVPISDGGKLYNIELIAGKHEEIKTGAGKFNALQLDAKIFNGRYIRRSGQMLVWVSDDARRIPVRAKIKTSGVTVTIELTRMQL